MQYSKLLENLNNLSKCNIKQKEIAEVLNLTPQAFSNRIKRGVELSSADIKKIENKYNIKYQEKNTKECINIPKKGDVSAGLGIGQEVFNEDVTEYFPLPKSLFKEIGANPQTSCIINTSGESMFPTIVGGSDKILIDFSKKEIYDGKIYLIRYDNTLFAKRLQKLPNNKLRVISDNVNYEPYTINLSDKSLNFDVIGRVMWISRVL